MQKNYGIIHMFYSRNYLYVLFTEKIDCIPPHPYHIARCGTGAARNTRIIP